MTVKDELVTSRRALIGGVLVLGAGLAAGGAVALGASEASAEEEAAAPDLQEGVRYGFWIDTTRCVGCGECVAACVTRNQTPEDLEPRRRVAHYADEYGTNMHVSTSCMHCAEPACATVCPAGAISKRNDGIVVVDKGRCMGCKYCYQACPFEVPRYNGLGMDKCDCCLGTKDAPGDSPACVLACNKGALHYGTIASLEEKAGESAVLICAPTSPSCLIS